MQPNTKLNLAVEFRSLNYEHHELPTQIICLILSALSSLLWITSEELTLKYVTMNISWVELFVGAYKFVHGKGVAYVLIGIAAC